MKTRRATAAAAAVIAAALVLSSCTVPQSRLVAGSSLSVAWDQPFYSYNGTTSFGNSTANNNVIYATNSFFNYYDDTPALVRDPSFGSYTKLSDDPLVVRYTIADGVKWSDGRAVDSADLLLNWVALSGADNTQLDARKYRDPKTGELTKGFPRDAVFFDSGSDPTTGLGLARRLPEVSADRKSITITYDSPFVDWELALTSVGRPAHVVAARALGISDPSRAKEAIITAITSKDLSALASISRFWNSGFNFTELPADTSLLVGNGPYVITGFVAGQSVTLTANKNYLGSHQPRVQQITIRFIADPLAAVQALQAGEVQVISPQATVEVTKALAALRMTVVGTYQATFEHIDLQFDHSKSGNFNNPLIRQAFLKVIPRQEIVDKLIVPLRPDATVRNSHIFLPGAAGYEGSIAANGSGAYKTVDIEGARALLAQAGVPNPEVCVLFSPGNPRRVAEFQLIRQSAALAGFTVTDCSSPGWVGLLGTPGVYDAALFGWQARSLGVTDGAPPTFNSRGINNLDSYSNPEVDRLTERLGKEFDPARQIELEKQIDKLLWGDFYGMPIFQFPAVTAFDPKAISGIAPSTLAPTLFWNIWDWSPTVGR